MALSKVNPNLITQGPSGRKNLIINGAMQVAQRGIESTIMEVVVFTRLTGFTQQKREVLQAHLQYLMTQILLKGFLILQSGTAQQQIPL